MTFISGTLISDTATSLLAYVGPGLGLGTVAIVLGVMLSVFLAVVGVIWYPIKRLIRSFFRKAEPTAQSSTLPLQDK